MKITTFADDPHAPHNDNLTDDLYVLCEDWDYIYIDDGQLKKMHFKKGIIYDGASTPNIFSLLGDVHPNGALRPSALPHDILFIFQGKNFPKGMMQKWFNGRWIEDEKEWTLKEADKLFKRINFEYDVMPRWKTKLTYRVLTLGSWKPWKSKDVKSRAQIKGLYE